MGLGFEPEWSSIAIATQSERGWLNGIDSAAGTEKGTMSTQLKRKMCKLGACYRGTSLLAVALILGAIGTIVPASNAEAQAFRRSETAAGAYQQCVKFVEEYDQYCFSPTPDDCTHSSLGYRIFLGRPIQCGSGVLLWSHYEGPCPGGGTWDDEHHQCVGSGNKNSGRPEPMQCPSLNPINPATGNKFQVETDYQGPADFGLSFKRYYNSDSGPATPTIGEHWRHSFEANIEWDLDDSATNASTPVLGHAFVSRPDGKRWIFTVVLPGQAGTQAGEGEPNVRASLFADFDANDNILGWSLSTPDDRVETYNASGQLISVTLRNRQTITLTHGAHGVTTVTGAFNSKTLTLQYDTNGRVDKLIDPAGNEVRYEYDGQGRLEYVHYPDGDPGATDPYRQYTYDATVANALTSIRDERGKVYVSYTYDATSGLVTSGTKAGGLDTLTLLHNASAGTVTATDEHGTSAVYTLTDNFGTAGWSAASGPCAHCNLHGDAFAFDALTGFIDSATDFNGFTTFYDHNARGLETSRTETISGTETRTVTTTWNADYRVPEVITRDGQTETRAYNTAGTLSSYERKDTASQSTQTTTYTYHAGTALLDVIDGPRTDVTDTTDYDYDTLTGELDSVTNAEGHQTLINTYDAHGRPLTLTDPNGLDVTMAYHPRGWLTSLDLEGRTTTYTYEPTGQAKRITAPDGSWVEYTYDDSGDYITEIVDRASNKQTITRDAVAHTETTEYRDSSNNLHRSFTQYRDSLDRIYKTVDGSGATVELGFDDEGQLTSTKEGNKAAHNLDYDGVGRLSQDTNPLSHITEFDYDARDNLEVVTDPLLRETTFSYSGLDEQTQRASPDSGTTSHDEFDGAGNLKKRTDARGVVSLYTYDALNRLTTIDLPGTDEDITFGYDDTTAGNNGLGRLTSVSDSSGTTDFVYNVHGDITDIDSTVNSQGGATITNDLSFGYDTSGRLSTVTYPSGRVVTYGYDDGTNGTGRLASLTLDGTTSLISNIVYRPFGPAKSWSVFNGLTVEREHDLSYRLDIQNVKDGGTVTYQHDYTFEATSHDITGLTTPWDTNTYVSDDAGRLTTSTSTGPAGDRVFVYDELGNRKSLTINNANTALIPTANTSLQQYTHNDAGRLETITVGGTDIASYLYNTLGQRVEKLVGTTATQFYFGQSGELLGERLGTGAYREYVYFEGTPVAMVETASGSTTVYAIHSDHLGTPFALTDSAKTEVWKSQYAPFGMALVDTDPDGDSTDVTMNVRFPGQYFDEESGLHYNYHRYYDPSTGRYLRSDPIGLEGGINTYLYALANPLRYTDPFGLVSCTCRATGPGDRYHPSSKMVGELREKICVYDCRCDCPESPLKIEFSAGASESAQCLGQETILPHHTQPGSSGSTTFDVFRFDTESLIDRFTPLGPPLEFMDLIEKKCKGEKCDG